MPTCGSNKIIEGEIRWFCTIKIRILWLVLVANITHPLIGYYQGIILL